MLPNIYRIRNYKLLIIIPFLFILASLYFIPRIPAGIDLRGGILITLQAQGEVDEGALSEVLKAQLGVRDVSVKSTSSPLGTAVEIEIEQNERLADAERAVRDFFEQYELYTKADYEYAQAKSALERGAVGTDEQKLRAQMADAEARRNAAWAAMDSKSEESFTSIAPFIGEVDRSNATDAKALRDLVSASFARAKDAYRDRVLSALRSGVSFTNFTYKDVSPSLSEFFLQKTIQVVIISFTLTTIVVFLVFRSFIPSLAVIFGALNDIAFALGAMGLLGIPFTLASLGALLMLIGFSLDTDVLLTIRIIKRTEGDPRDRAYGAMKTGLTMSATAITAFAVLLVLSQLTQLATYYHISVVAIAGLVGDIIATWCTNAVMVLWYVESKAKG